MHLVKLDNSQLIFGLRIPTDIRDKVRGNTDRRIPELRTRILTADHQREMLPELFITFQNVPYVLANISIYWQGYLFNILIIAEVSKIIISCLLYFNNR